MEHHRILCLRFPNWPVQAHRLRISREGGGAAAIALHTLQPESGAGAAAADADTQRDLAFLRELFPAARSGAAVVAVSSAAWHQGVRPGLPLAEARSLAAPPQSSLKSPPPSAAKKTQAARGKRAAGSAAEPVLFVPWTPAADREELRLLSDPVRRFAPVVGVDSLPLPDSLLLDVTGCGALFGGEEQLARELLQLLRESGLRGRVAIADTIASAWALAHTDGVGSPELVIVSRETSGKQLASLPVAAARIAPGDLEILQHLGILRIGQLLALPIEDLPARLSGECVLRVRQLRGDVVEQIVPLPEVSPVQAAWVGDEPASGIRDLQWILGRLSEDIARQLDQRRLACSGLHCEFIAVDGRTLEMPAGLVRPERTPQLLAEVTSLRLEFLMLQQLRTARSQRVVAGNKAISGVEDQLVEDGTAGLSVLPPLDFGALAEQPIAAVRVTAVSAPIPQGRQRRLFADTGEESADVTEPLGTLLSRLAGRLGADAVLTVHERDDPRPEHSFGFLPVGGAGFEGRLEALAGTGGGGPVDRRKDRGRSGESRFPEPAVLERGQLSSVDCRPARPLRLLPEPVEVSLEWFRGGGSGEQTAGEALLRGQGRDWRVVEWTGPERIQTAWWTDAVCHRDYYQAVSEEGARFWLFRDLLQGRWYLHGLFD